MGKKKDDDKGEDKGEVTEVELVELTLELSDQSVDMLEALAGLGIYGPTPEEIAGRFVDERLQEMAGTPEFSYPKK